MDAKDVTRLELENQIKMSRVALEALDHLPNEFPGWINIGVYQTSFTVFINTLSPEDFAKARRLLGKSVYPIRRRFFGTTGSRVHVYTHKALDCTIQLSLEPGGVCQRVQVGERTIPVYEVRCGEVEGEQ